MHGPKVVLVTGGFDPLHSGHIEYFKSARELGDILVVGLNSDEWLTRKKGQPFMSFTERKSIIENLRMVDNVISFDDSDDSSINAIYKVNESYKNSSIIFANGGDRTKDNIPEKKIILDNIEFVFEVGGSNKRNSSSTLLENFKSKITERPWGYYKVLNDQKTYKVKELVVESKKSLSLQKHNNRNEHWYILSGKCDVLTIFNEQRTFVTKNINDFYTVKQNVWHQIQNNYDTDCHILEIQYGTICDESDIERKDA